MSEVAENVEVVFEEDLDLDSILNRYRYVVSDVEDDSIEFETGNLLVTRFLEEGSMEEVWDLMVFDKGLDSDFIDDSLAYTTVIAELSKAFVDHELSKHNAEYCSCPECNPVARLNGIMVALTLSDALHQGLSFIAEVMYDYKGWVETGDELADVPISVDSILTHVFPPVLDKLDGDEHTNGYANGFMKKLSSISLRYKLGWLDIPEMLLAMYTVISEEYEQINHAIHSTVSKFGEAMLEAKERAWEEARNEEKTLH